jgi:hypothetical protein
MDIVPFTVGLVLGLREVLVISLCSKIARALAKTGLGIEKIGWG